MFVVRSRLRPLTLLLPPTRHGVLTVPPLGDPRIMKVGTGLLFVSGFPVRFFFRVQGGLFLGLIPSDYLSSF